MRKLLGILSICVMSMAYSLSANAGEVYSYGVTLHAGSYETDGSETEKTVSGVTSETTNHTAKEGFYGASVFVERKFDFMNGFVLGLDYVPMDIQLGKGQREDTSGAADVASEADTGVRKAEANLENLVTVYAHLPVGPGYVLLGYHDGDITTQETLETSTYGDASVNGYQLGYGVKNDNIKLEVAYSDFDEITLTSSNSDTIKADADTVSVRLSIGF